MKRSISKALLAAGLSPLALVAQPASAQGVVTAAGDTTSGDADATIIVTGTRRADRTVADSPVPVDVITADSLQTSGYTETNRLLNEQIPSFNFPQPSITDG